MADTTNYQGSQAFSQSLSGMESVNPNTGTLSLNKQLVALRGPTKSSNLKLDLRFAQGALGVYGLPSGWSLNLPFVIMQGATAMSLTMPGATYSVDPDWNREYGVESGLAYVNKKGVYFRTCDADARTPLAGKRPKYSFASGNGRIYYFDVVGRLIEHCDQFGVGMVVTYRQSAGGQPPQKTLIDNLQLQYTDGGVAKAFGPALTFHYSGGTNLALQLGSTEVCSFRWDTGGVTRIFEEGQTSALIESGSFANQPVINRIQYWNGLTTDFEYQELPYYDGSRDNEQSFAAIKSHIHSTLESNSNRVRLGQTDYAFGEHTSGNTFTGFEAGLVMQQTNDALIEAANPDYRYDVTIRQIDSNDQVIGRTDVYYNSFHAPIQTDTFADPGAEVPSFRLRPAYDQIGRNALTARNFNLPVSKSLYAVSGETEVLKVKETYAYTDFGKLGEKVTYLDGSGTAARQENHTFVETADGRSIPQQSDFYDGVVNRTTRQTYTFDTAQAAIKSIVSKFADGSPGALDTSPPWTKWKQTAMTYDESGRIRTRTTSWAEGLADKPDAMTPPTVSFEHTLDGNQFTVTVTNAAGASTSSIYDLSMPTGPQTSFTNAEKETTNYTYDAYGNPVSVTTPSNLTTHYSVARAGVNSAGGVNSVTSSVATTGYTIVRETDALDRVVKLSDNGTGTATLSDTPTRVLRCHTYDAAGRLMSSLDELCQSEATCYPTTFTYDGLGRVTSKTLPDGSVAAMAYDEAAGACLISLGGAIREVRRSDPLGRLVARDVYPVAGSSEEPVSHQSVYSGHGKALSQSLLTFPPGTAASATPPQGTLRSKITHDYDTDGKVIFVRRQGATVAQGQETHAIVRDLLGNVTSMSRTVVDAKGNSSEASSEAYTFDNTGALTTIESKFGGTERRVYDQAGRITGLTLPDSAFKYTYVDGALTQVELSGSDNETSGDMVTYEVDDRGQVTSVATGGDPISYVYLPDGALASVIYEQPDKATQNPGKAMVLDLDDADRITKATDPNGVVTETTYDDLGQIKTRSQNGTTMTFAYSGKPQRLDTITFAGKQSGTLTVAYDDFDHPAGGTLKTGDQAVLLDVAITRDWAGRTSKLVMSSAVLSGDPAVNLAVEFDYDVLGRLASRTVTPSVGGGAAITTEFTFDAAGNLLSETGPAGSRTFEYNAFNQLTGGARYDGNGRMTDDGQGRTYAFDAWDRLIQKTDSAGATDLTYWPDGSLKSVTQGGETRSFAYLGGAVTSSTVGDVTTGMLRAHGMVHATTSQDGTSDALLGSGNGSTVVALSSGTAKASSYAPFGQSDGAAADGLAAWHQELQLNGGDLSYLRARWHSPAIGRFISADPTLQFNRYAFTDGDPTNQSDPTGLLSAFWDTLLVIGLTIILDLATDGAASVLAPELNEAAEGEELSTEASGIAEDRTALEGDRDTLRGLKRLKSSGSDSVSRSTSELEDSVAKQEDALAKREANYSRRMTKLNRYKRFKFLRNKWIMSPVISVTEDAIHRAIKGEPLNWEALESFGLDIVLSEFFVGLKVGAAEREGEGILMHALRGLPYMLFKKVIGSSVHRAFDLGGLSYIPPISIVATVFGGIGSPGGRAGAAFESALGSVSVPVRLHNADGSVGSGGLSARDAGGPFAALSAKGAISNAQTLADAVQISVFNTGRALHAAR